MTEDEFRKHYEEAVADFRALMREDPQALDRVWPKGTWREIDPYSRWLAIYNQDNG